MRILLIMACLLLTACGRYAEFRLADPGQAEEGHWEWHAEAAPVMPNEAVDTLNPSILPWRGALWNFYSVYDGRVWHTHSAKSSNGLAWTDSRRILSPNPPDGRAATSPPTARPCACRARCCISTRPVIRRASAWLARRTDKSGASTRHPWSTLGPAAPGMNARWPTRT